MDSVDAARPLSERYWYLDGTDATRVDVDVREFWQQVMTGAPRDDIVGRIVEADGWLVGVYDMADDMTHEEMHPYGDELHYLVSGRVDLVLARADLPGSTEQNFTMTPGTSTAVPRGVWHRFVVHEPARGIAITAGRGTEHRPLDREEPR